MARNAEKAMTTLARWRAAQLNEKGGVEKERRPYLASECDDLGEAEKWRHQIIREIARKVSQIQNAGLGEYRIRDLNDEINKLIREKRHWEVRIRELGGPDYTRIGPRMIDHEGKEVPGNRGYKYFGAAKYLPGVRELFEQEPPPPPKKTRSEIMKDVDVHYYVCREEDDDLLIPLEQIEEQKVIQKALEELNENEENDDTIIKTTETPKKNDEEKFIAHVRVPSQNEIERALLKRKKQELLQKYTTNDYIIEENESDHVVQKENEEEMEED